MNVKCLVFNLHAPTIIALNEPMRGELESVCQTVTANNKREAQIESTNDNQKKAPVR